MDSLPQGRHYKLLERIHSFDFVKTNRFLGMAEATAKHELTKNINRFKLLFPGEYSFYPESFVLPDELPRLKVLAEAEASAAAQCASASLKRPDARRKGSSSLSSK